MMCSKTSGKTKWQVMKRWCLEGKKKNVLYRCEKAQKEIKTNGITVV